MRTGAELSSREHSQRINTEDGEENKARFIDLTVSTVCKGQNAIQSFVNIIKFLWPYNLKKKESIKQVSAAGLLAPSPHQPITCGVDRVIITQTLSLSRSFKRGDDFNHFLFLSYKECRLPRGTHPGRSFLEGIAYSFDLGWTVRSHGSIDVDDHIHTHSPLFSTSSSSYNATPFPNYSTTTTVVGGSATEHWGLLSNRIK